MRKVKMKKILFNNKKGIFYLLISSLFLAVMIFVFLAYEQYGFVDRQKVIETRIQTINDFIKDIDTDSKRVIYISGFRALIAVEDYVASSGAYLNNSEKLFRIAFYNGTVNGTDVDILENSSYFDYLQKLQVIAGRVGIDIYINVTNIILYHDSPWSVKVVVTAHVNITDNKGLANWDFYKDYNTSVSLKDIRDPVYSVYTLGRVPNTIRITNITDFVNDSNNDTTNLQNHTNHSYYKANTLAPSFLMRLEGNFSSSPYGIESLIYIPELIEQDVQYNDGRSIVDYILFSNITGYSSKACDVQNMPNWFKIDINHTSDYEVDKLSYTPCG
ncbi:hypothetical protein AYK26_00420 [Euryarchaeota archaeon SM23-78]|nr:MAG: hypothetical protein AYK26_00420 [Euryarchaeota archaeon SM23-78]